MERFEADRSTGWIEVGMDTDELLVQFRTGDEECTHLARKWTPGKARELADEIQHGSHFSQYVEEKRAAIANELRDAADELEEVHLAEDY